jgi:putative CocE/NonD family hydrolase
MQYFQAQRLERCQFSRPRHLRTIRQRYSLLCVSSLLSCSSHLKSLLMRHRFHSASFAEVPEEHHSPHSAWETPDPGYWTGHGYAIVRADEVGLGQSPGVLNTMSRDTSLAFKDVIEWAASQTWSSGKVGLLGISYYAGSQWRVAARQPKGLACIVPWEGMSDYYRDRCRHGGILSNTFIDFWWNRQVSCSKERNIHEISNSDPFVRLSCVD